MDQSHHTVNCEEIASKVKSEEPDQFVKTEPEELVCVVCIKPHLENFEIFGTEITVSYNISVHDFLNKFTNTEIAFSPDKYICKTCYNIVNELEQLEIEYNKLKDAFQTLIRNNPLFNKTQTQSDENEVETNVIKNDTYTDLIDNSKNEDSARLSKKRKLDSKQKKIHWSETTEKTEQLIDIVKNYAVLYDPSHASYKNIKIRNKVWDIIANVMGEKDGEIVKAQWRNLRDSYSKYLWANTSAAKQTTTNKNIERYKAWPWANQMQFLRPFIECASTISTVRESETENTQKLTDGSLDYQAGGFTEKPILISKQYLPKKISPDDKINNYFPKTLAEYDGTSLLFLGYSKIVNKMSIRLQAKVKFEVAKIMMEAEIENAGEMQPQNNVFRDIGTMNTAAQEHYIAPSDVTMEEPRQFAIICAPPLNLQGGSSLSQSHVEDSNVKCAQPLNFANSKVGENNISQSQVDDPIRFKAAVEKAERLIEIIKNYAILYDRSLSGYKNVKKKNMIWDNIAHVIGDKDGETVKAKWQILRDSYSRYLRSRKADSEQIDSYKWPWMDQMQFLRPYVECLATNSHVASESDAGKS